MGIKRKLIDREIFFGNPEIASGNISPDGSMIAFMQTYEGIMNLYVKGVNEKFDQARVLTKSKSPILGYFWTHDSRFILYVNDKNGDENKQAAVNLSAAPSLFSSCHILRKFNNCC